MAPLSRRGIVPLVALSALLWALSHGYHGLVHDARLYTLQALAHLHPESVANDVFLKFGSQDRFTVFSPLYAGLAGVFGLEPTAAILTLLFQLGLLASVWLLARRVLPASLAWVAVATVIALPGDYGADRIFTCVEPFLTPRMAAEALTLCALTAAFSGRVVIAIASALAATLLHPIMAAAGWAALLIHYCALPRPRAAAFFAVGAAAVLASLALIPAVDHALRFDPEWLHLVQARSPYLFVTNWVIEDWAPAGLSAVTLAVAAGALPGAPATLARVALLTTVAGLLLSLLTTDMLQWVPATQLQPWRWQWLGTLTAALLLAPSLGSLISRGTAGRVTALTLSAAWLFAGSGYALVAAAAAAASLCATRLKPTELRLVFCGAGGLFLIAAIWRIASNLEFTELHYLELDIPYWARAAMSFVHDGSLPVAAILLVWWAAGTRRGGIAATALTLLAVAGVAALLPLTWKQWTSREVTGARAAQYIAWRALIPVTAEVFWPEAPLSAWLLLERPSYLSIVQTSGLVFSHDAAIELKRRALALSHVIPPEAFLGWTMSNGAMGLSKEQMRSACNIGAFAFVVTRANFGVDPVAMIPEPGATRISSQRLYRCPLGDSG